MILLPVAPRPVQERAAPLPRASQGVSAASRITLAPELLYSSPKLRELKLELLLRLPFREALHHERTHHCLAPLQLRAQMSDELGVAQRVAGRLPVDGGRLPSFVVRLVARAAGGACGLAAALLGRRVGGRCSVQRMSQMKPRLRTRRAFSYAPRCTHMQPAPLTPHPQSPLR